VSNMDDEFQLVVALCVSNYVMFNTFVQLNVTQADVTATWWA